MNIELIHTTHWQHGYQWLGDYFEKREIFEHLQNTLIVHQYLDFGFYYILLKNYLNT